uniref:tRNA dimethylallyltransferase 2 n=1 Tax=Kalanchoe fedtschenkoi TaxID=63787 RepID=A0A7N0U8F4_KALFE
MEKRSEYDDGDAHSAESGTRKNIVVIMGATGCGKSRLAIDLAAHFPVEIINADSMQVYRGLDVLTNKVPIHDQKGVRHHLLGCVSPSSEFTAKDFRDAAMPIIDDILSRNCLPVVVGGTNYYIQSLISRFLLDESIENLDGASFSASSVENENESEEGSSDSTYDRLTHLDLVAACRIHPNDHRKISQYLRSYSRSGILPSALFQGPAIKNWGLVDELRYDCCFICVDASLPIIDKYVNDRVDCMVASGLLDEVRDIYVEKANYTRGLRQAIGVREFEEFLKLCPFDSRNNPSSCRIDDSSPHELNNRNSKDHMLLMLNSLNFKDENILLRQAIDDMKMHTRRLVRRQKRRIDRLQSLFGWKINFVDASESLSSGCPDLWAMHVVQPSVKTIRSFLNDNGNTMEEKELTDHKQKILERDLWSQYTCEACGNKVLRGAHEWEQHRQGRGHRKRIASLRKSHRFA